MLEPQAKKPVRYMDFISRKPLANSDPLASRPAARPVKKPVIKRVSSVADQIPPKSAHREIVQTRIIHHETIQTSVVAPKVPTPPVQKPETPEVAVKREEMKPFISRQPSTTREFYANPSPNEPHKTPTLTTHFSDNLSEKLNSPDSSPDNNAYSINGKSPFLKHYSVDKRPLSSSVPEKKPDSFEKLSFLGVSEQREDSRHRKNVYKKNEVSKKTEEKAKTVKIIDDTEKPSGFPTWAIILITIILGMVVGAGVYYILPK